jgi:hypothetical protein
VPMQCNQSEYRDKTRYAQGYRMLKVLVFVVCGVAFMVVRAPEGPGETKMCGCLVSKAETLPLWSSLGKCQQCLIGD